MRVTRIRNYLTDRIPPVIGNRGEIGIAYICYLPFRLQTGKITKYDCSFGGNTIDIWVYNEILLVPSDPDTALFDVLKPDMNLTRLTSKLMIHFKNPMVEDEDFDKIVMWTRTDQKQSTNTIKNIFQASVALNRLLVACNAASHETFSGEEFKKISVYELLIEGLLVTEDIIIASEGFSFSKQEAEGILSSIPTMNVRLDRWRGSAHAVSEEIRQEVQQILNKYLDHMLFYELLFEAKSKAITDSRGALIQAAMAFENAIWLILEFELEKKFLEVRDSFKDESERAILSENYIKKTIGDFGRELGLTLLIQTLPYLFFNGNEMLKPTEIKDAVNAIKARNKLIHSKKTKSNDYFWSTWNQEFLSKHYSALYKSTLKLSPLIKKRIDGKDDEEVGGDVA